MKLEIPQINGEVGWILDREDDDEQLRSRVITLSEFVKSYTDGNESAKLIYDRMMRDLSSKTMIQNAVAENYLPVNLYSAASEALTRESLIKSIGLIDKYCL